MIKANSTSNYEYALSLDTCSKYGRIWFFKLLPINFFYLALKKFLQGRKHPVCENYVINYRIEWMLRHNNAHWPILFHVLHKK